MHKTNSSRALRVLRDGIISIALTAGLLALLSGSVHIDMWPRFCWPLLAVNSLTLFGFIRSKTEPTVSKGCRHQGRCSKEKRGSCIF